MQTIDLLSILKATTELKLSMQMYTLIGEPSSKSWLLPNLRVRAARYACLIRLRLVWPSVDISSAYHVCYVICTRQMMLPLFWRNDPGGRNVQFAGTVCMFQKHDPSDGLQVRKATHHRRVATWFFALLPDNLGVHWLYRETVQHHWSRAKLSHGISRLR